MKRPNRRKWIVGLAAACVVLFAAALLGSSQLSHAPFATTYSFNGQSGVYPGASGRVYVIDQSKKMVVIADEENHLVGTIPCGNDSDTKPFYAALVAEGEDGSIFLADVRYSGKGTRICQERIFHYDRNGKNGRVIYQIDYAQEETAPMQYGSIQSLRVMDGTLVFTEKSASGVSVCRLDPETGEFSSTAYSLPGQYLSDSDVDPNTMRPVFTNRLGQLCAVTEEGGVEILADTGRTGWMLCAEKDAVYYTDMAAMAVLRYDWADKTEQIVLQGEDILYAVQLSGEKLYATDYVGYYCLENGVTTYTDTLTYPHPALTCALWGCLFLGCALLIALLVLLALPLFGKKKSELFERVAIVLFVSLSIGALVSYITINQMIENQNDTVMEELNFFDDILVGATDVEALKRVDAISDYRNEDYCKVKDALDLLTDKTYENDLNYYYVLYTADETTIYVVMDYEETSVTRHPVYPWGTEGYSDVFITGEPVEFPADFSSYGACSFVLKPIFDETGTVVAAMEVGANLDALAAANKALIRDVLLTVLSATVVLMMCIIEIIFYAEFRGERSRALAAGTLQAPGRQFPLRTLAFLMYLADCMQDPFVSILANDLYTPVLGIPQSVGAALPLSAQVLFAALSAFVCGSLVRRTGVKKMLCGGFLTQGIGFVLCGTCMNYAGLLAGKALIGVGIGAALVSLNSVAASGESEEASADAFTQVNAGTLAGITVGAGVGSILLSFAGYSVVYYAGALTLCVALLLSLFGADYREKTAAAREQKEITMLRFLTNRSVWSFLLLLLMPFLIAISYREYFFPLYAADAGMTETDIGRIYLLCGLVVIYLGPVLTRTLIEKIGGKWTTVTASALMIVATLLFAFVPTMAAALVALALLSAAVSFGYAAQSTYYSGLEPVRAYGEGRAMGIYSLFDNGGQTLGPVVYGLALLAGNRMGTMIVGGGLLILLLLFLLASGIRKKKNKGRVPEKEA